MLRFVQSDEAHAWAWAGVPRPRFVGGNRLRLLEGGVELFPAMTEAMAQAREEVWFATYIFHEDAAARQVAEALVATAARGVRVHVVVDGFGSLTTLPALRRWLEGSGVRLEVFRPLDRWWSWVQPGQMRRMHQKLCVIDSHTAFVGGINVIDDRHDLNHGWTEQPRLDFAVEVKGPLAGYVHATARAMWARARLGHLWGEELRALAGGAAPVEEAMALWRRLRGKPDAPPEPLPRWPMRAAFVVRDNLRQRRAIERSYVEAIRLASERIDLAVPYFYPGQRFRRALRNAARRGVQIRLLLQGKVDYRIASWAARALYEELRGYGVRVFEYTPAFLHAKVAVVDSHWATVGSSNIDPISLLLNLEANVVADDAAFAATVAGRLEQAFAVSHEVTRPLGPGWRNWLQRALVAWVATLYLRLGGVVARY